MVPQGSFPPAALFVVAIVGTTTPSDSRCAALDFAFGAACRPLPYFPFVCVTTHHPTRKHPTTYL